MRFYEANLSERVKGRFRYEVRGYLDSLYVFDRPVCCLPLYTVIYTDTNLKPYMEWLFVPNYLRESGDISCYAISYSKMDLLGVRVGQAEDLKSPYRITVDQEPFFSADETVYLSYQIERKGTVLVKGIIPTEGGTYGILQAEKAVTEQMENILARQRITALPDPLQRVVRAQADTDSGMLFLEQDEGWDTEQLKALQEQVAAYGLETYLEVETDPDTLPEGEPVITAYCGLAEQFNLLAM